MNWILWVLLNLLNEFEGSNLEKSSESPGLITLFYRFERLGLPQSSLGLMQGQDRDSRPKLFPAIHISSLNFLPGQTSGSWLSQNIVNLDHIRELFPSLQSKCSAQSGRRSPKQPQTIVLGQQLCQGSQPCSVSLSFGLGIKHGTGSLLQLPGHDKRPHFPTTPPPGHKSQEGLQNKFMVTLLSL